LIVAIAGVAGILIALMWGVIGISIMRAHDSATERTREEAQNLAAVFQDEVTHALARVGSTLDLIAERMRRVDGSFDLHAWLAETPMLGEGAAQMAIIGPDGMMRSTSLEAHVALVDLNDREHFRVHIDDPRRGLFIGKPVIGRVSGKAT